MLQLIVFVSFCWFSSSIASDPDEKPPGIVVRESVSGLTFASNYGAKRFMAGYILRSLRNTTFMGRFFFDIGSLTNFIVKDYLPPKSNVTFKRGIGIAWNLTEAELAIGLNYELKTTDVEVTGDATVVLSGLSLSAEFTIGRGINDSLFVSLTQCSVDVRARHSEINETWEGNNTHQQRDLFSKKIHNYLEDRVYESVTKAMCNWARFVAGIPDRINSLIAFLGVYHGITLDTRLVRDPIVKADYIEAAFRGEFRVLGDEERASFQTCKFDIPLRKSSMFSIYISEYVANTLYDALFKKNWLSINITKEFLPPKYRDLFDTTCETICLGTIFPQVAAKYPNVSATFEIKAATPPRLTYTWFGQRSHGVFDFNIVIPGVNGSEGAVAKLSMSFSITKTVFVSIDRLEGRVFYPNITITDKGSPQEFADDLSRFSYVLQLIVDFILIPNANYMGAVGISPLYIPFSGIRLVHAKARVIKCAFGFSTDFVYEPFPL